ncbi:MAG: DNA-binding protein WhiA [Clostridia bacterium]|nr:DNA-binding protein WhiA [Clostridia bacterium]
MTFSAEVKEEILNLKMWDQKSTMPQEEQIKRLHIRELFLKSGFINNPKKDYHLEIIFGDEPKAIEIEKLLLEFDIPSKTIKKGRGYMLYIKDGEEISNFLALIGAMSSVLKFEEVRVERELKNNINRAVNCETANLNKTIDAAIKQIEAIEKIKKQKKFESIPDTLKEIANLRVENPHASLIELGQMLEKPIGKSGVNHRLKKILELAEEL